MLLTLAVSWTSHIDSDTGADELRAIVRINNGVRVQDVSDVYRLVLLFQVADDVFEGEQNASQSEVKTCHYLLSMGTFWPVATV